MQIEITNRHGSLGTGQARHFRDKAEKLVKYFDRLMAVEVAVDHGKHVYQVEIRASAEHKHDFFAKEEGPTPEAAMDLCVHKVEEPAPPLQGQDPGSPPGRLVARWRARVMARRSDHARALARQNRSNIANGERPAARYARPPGPAACRWRAG